jgi:hypothetical protein
LAASQASTPATPHRRDYTSAIYGSVLAASVILGAGAGRSPWVLALILLVSNAIFWVAHVYAEIAASVQGGWGFAAIGRGLRHEWPLAFAAVPPAVAAVAAGVLFHARESVATWAALITALVELQVWGLAAARAVPLRGVALIRTIVLNLALGFVVVALKLSLPH